jgi:hypothetical protein
MDAIDWIVVWLVGTPIILALALAVVLWLNYRNRPKSNESGMPTPYESPRNTPARRKEQA